MSRTERGADSAAADEVSGQLATRVINALRQGSNLLESVSLFSEGRESIHRAADSLMDELSYSGGSAVRWLKGSYGSGKTHTFARLMEAAHSKRWIVSYVEVSGRGQGCELQRFEEVYAAVIKNCAVPSESRAGQHSEDVNDWPWLLDRWVAALKLQAGSPRGGDVQTFRVRDAIHTTMTQLRTSFGISGSFGAALAVYANAILDSDPSRATLILDWFSGVDVFKQGNDVRRSLRECGIQEVVARKNAKVMLRQFTAFLRYRGYQGMLILFDEVENVLLLPPSARRSAYTIVRELIDNVDARHGMSQTLLYLSGTPDLFDGAKGIAEYEALASRVMLPSSSAQPNPAASVIDLEAFPITIQDLRAMAKRIAILYVKTEHGSRLDRAESQKLVQGLVLQRPLPSPRTWVRSVVDALDRI